MQIVSQPKAPTRACKREAILNATLQLIATGGIDSITFRRVADQATVSLGSTTYYFDSREDLLRTAFKLHRNRCDEKLNLLQDLYESEPNRDLIEFLIELTKIEFKTESSVVVGFEFTLLAARDRELAKELHDWHRNLVSRVASTLEQSGIDKPFQAAHCILQFVRGYELDYITRQKPELEDLRKQLELVLAAFKPK